MNCNRSRLGVSLAGLALMLCVVVGCAQTRTVVVTNGSTEAFELRKDGAKTAIVVDPGGSTRLNVSEGEPIDVNGTLIQVY